MLAPLHIQRFSILHMGKNIKGGVPSLPDPSQYIEKEDLKRMATVRGAVRRLQQFLLVNEIRIPFAVLRYIYFRYILRYFKTYQLPNEKHFGNKTFEHNFEKIYYSITHHGRVQHIIRPVVAIASVATRLKDLKTLSIGPRSEGELLLIAGYGFSWGNIRGIDLFSYCPRIDVGDMHDLPYPDNSFDIVFNGWCLAYSDDQERALKEMVRILKPGGIIALGQGYSRTQEEYLAEFGEAPLGTQNRSNSIDEIFAPIAENVDTYYFRHDVTPEMSKNKINSIIAVLSIKK